MLTIISILLIIASVIVGIFLLKKKKKTTTEQEYQKVIDNNSILNTHVIERLSKFATDLTESNVIFTGDSNTELLESYSEFNTIKNRGIAGGSTSTIISILTKNVPYLGIIAENPKKVFLMIGTNDLQGGLFENLKLNYTNIVNSILLGCKCHLYVQSILPVNWVDYTIPNGSKITNEKVNQINLFIQTIAAMYPSDITYIDVNSLVRDETGKLNKIYTDDGLHLNNKGHELWWNKVKDYI